MLKSISPVFQGLAWLSFLFSAASIAAPSVTWTPSSVTQTIPAGGSTTIPVSFTASKKLSNAVVRVVPEIEPFVQVNPVLLGNVANGQTVNLGIIVSAPTNSPPGTLHGTIQLRSGGKAHKTFAKPLPVTIVVSGATVGPEGGTVTGADGTSITLPPGAIDYEAVMDIARVPTATVVAPTGDLEIVAAVEITFEPTAFNASHVPPSAPLEISIPAPAGIPGGSNFIAAQQALIDSINNSTPGLREQLNPVATASVIEWDIVTQTDIFPGIFGGGLFAIIQTVGSGFVTGIVSDATGPRPGVVISNNTNTLVSVSDATGRYTLFISGDSFTVTGFDPFKGSRGSTSGSIPVPDSTVAADILLTALETPPITRDGIRNGAFERGDLSSWALAGAGRAIQQFEPTSTGIVNRPTEGQWMAGINTGTGAIGEVGSSLKQRFIVPAGVRTLRLDFNFISEEFPEFVGSVFDDDFKAIITTPNGEMTFAQVNVNQSGGFELIGDCFFPGGDETCGQTGWRQGSVDLSAFAGTNIPITVDLIFSAIDAGDDIFDTHVLIDNIRFSTAWVDVKTIQGAAANQMRIQNEILGATEILSQAGVNVRLRNFQAVTDPGGLLDTDITWRTECRPPLACLVGLGTTKGVPTAEEIALMGLSRSATAVDVNVYYVRSFTGGAAGAFAIGPDDFHDINILTNAGTIHPDIAGGCTAGGHNLAHELGHLLISPQSAGDALEHNAGATNFLGGNCATPLIGIVTRQQSANVNRVGAPMLVP